jgi:hypothetical protein
MPTARRRDAGRSAPIIGRRSDGLFSPASWAELLYAVVDLVPATIFFVLTITFVALGAGLGVVWVGVPLLALGLRIARAGGERQRRLASALLALSVSGPGPVRPSTSGPIGAMKGSLTDGGSWRAALYHCLKVVLAPVTFTVAVTFYAAGLGGISYGVWHGFLPVEAAPDGSLHRGMQWWPGYFVDTLPRMAVLGVVSLALLLAAPRVVRFFTTLDRVLIAGLLSERRSAAG